MKTLLLTLIALAALTRAASCAEPAAAAPSPQQVRAKAAEVLGTLPAQMPGSEKSTAAQIELGRKLFMETRLSANQKQSCNSCHAVDQKRAGVDGEPTSSGAFGKRGNRNSPTVLNAGFHFAQFWDGRAATLEDQAKGPILNPVEMAMPNEKEVLQRLAADREYPKLFTKAFPQDNPKITYDNVARAIAAFERTLVTHDRFDDFLNGSDKALSAAQLHGLTRFLEMGCTTCHNGPVIGANSYQKVGLVNPYENTTDVGRSGVTKDDDDRFKFKVPSLRNVALTGPYFHDGAVAKLEQAVQKMAWMQLGQQLTPEDTQAIAAFLNALSDKERAAATGRPAGVTASLLIGLCKSISPDRLGKEIPRFTTPAGE